MQYSSEQIEQFKQMQQMYQMQQLFQQPNQNTAKPQVKKPVPTKPEKPTLDQQQLQSLTDTSKRLEDIATQLTKVHPQLVKQLETQSAQLLKAQQQINDQQTQITDLQEQLKSQQQQHQQSPTLQTTTAGGITDFSADQQEPSPEPQEEIEPDLQQMQMTQQQAAMQAYVLQMQQQLSPEDFQKFQAQMQSQMQQMYAAQMPPQAEPVQVPENARKNPIVMLSLYTKTVYKDFKAQNPSLTYQQCRQEISKQWKAMSQAQKDQFYVTHCDKQDPVAEPTDKANNSQNNNDFQVNPSYAKHMSLGEGRKSRQDLQKNFIKFAIAKGLLSNDTTTYDLSKDSTLAGLLGTKSFPTKDIFKVLQSAKVIAK